MKTKRTTFPRAEIVEFRLMRELFFLVEAANAETNLRKRLERLQSVGNVLESVLRILPEIDGGFWFESFQQQIDACQEKIDALHEDNEGWKIP